MSENLSGKALLDLIISKVREMATKFPDTYYVMKEEKGYCSYSEGKCSNGTEGCIFGQVLKDIGLNNEDTGDISYKLNTEFNIGYAYYPVKIKWCVYVQKLQDKGYCWGEAIKMADKLYSH